eukprot:2666703-Pyramimonas_sp.AAC.1
MPTGGRSAAITSSTCRTSSTSSTWCVWPNTGRMPVSCGATRQGVRPIRGETRLTAQPTLQKRCTSSSR